MANNTIATNLQRLVDAKSDIAEAIIEKGGTVNQGDGFEEFSDDIASIPSGGSDNKIVSKNELLLNAAKPRKTVPIAFSMTWEKIPITGTFAGAEYVWSDNYNVYCSYNGDNKVFDKTNMQWTNKTWNGLTSFDGRYVWNDGNNVYYSYRDNQYVLNRDTSTWSQKTWTGLTNFNGDCVWSRGSNIYYSAGSANSSTYQKRLNTSTGAWTNYTWTTPTSGAALYGKYIWTDGSTVYYSSDSTYSTGYSVPSYQWKLSTSSTWSNVSWSTKKPYSGEYVWSDGINTYYSQGTFNYKYNGGTTWADGFGSYVNLNEIWTDGFDIYRYYDNKFYKLKR